MRHLLLWVGLAGCFREPGGAPSPPRALRISDLAGVAAASSEAPRDLELALSFTALPDPEGPEPWLLPGHLDAALTRRLSFTRPSATLAAQRVALDVERAPDALRMRPVQPLAPGRYTLVWPYEPEPRTFALTVSASPALGAQWVESAPGQAATQVPSNLARALLRFDGHVHGALAQAVQLRQDGSEIPAAISVERCSAYGLPEGDCVWVEPQSALASGDYALALEGALETPGGAPIAAAKSTFQVSAEPDHTPPALLGQRCALDERALDGACVRSDERSLTVRGLSSEPVFASLLLTGNPQTERAMALSYAGAFSLQVQPLTAQGTATLQLRDLAGNVFERALSFELARGLAQLTIDELRPDPRGKEPAQEYVELLNFGTESVSLMGMTLSMDAFEQGRVVASSVMLAPGQRALLVGPDFDPRDESDGVLPSSVRVVPLAGPLSLPNRGCSLWLRDARGRRLAGARALPPLLEGQCTRRIGTDLRAGDAPAWELDARGGCSPGAESADVAP